MNRSVLYFLIAALGITYLFSTCGDEKKQKQQQQQQVYQKTPLDNLIVSLDAEPNYSIILKDMDYSQDSDVYKHDYKVVVKRALADGTDTLLVQETGFVPVPANVFNRYVNDLGMELVSKKDGVLEKNVAPPGYANYVGNEKYGQWKQDNQGNSFWEFYGKYQFMSMMFGMMSPARYGSWNDYDRNYRGTGGYYGSGGNEYGSRSTTANAGTTWSQKSPDFKSNVQQKAAASKTRSVTKTPSRVSTKKSTTTKRPTMRAPMRRMGGRRR